MTDDPLKMQWSVENDSYTWDSEGNAWHYEDGWKPTDHVPGIPDWLRQAHDLLRPTGEAGTVVVASYWTGRPSRWHPIRRLRWNRNPLNKPPRWHSART